MKHKNTFFIIFFSVFLVSGFKSTIAQSALSVNEVTITVSNLDKILPFYTDVLPFKVRDRFNIPADKSSTIFNLSYNSSSIKAVRLYLGDESLVLQEFVNTTERPIPPDSKSNDLWFQHIAIVVSDMNKAYQILKKNNVTHVSASPQTLPDYIPAASGIKAFYFRDPDGHNLELIYFPKNKGNPKWHKKNNSLFLGIDHTAIGVSNTPESKLFYENLGLKLAGKSENYGKEQEHLNQVFGARLEISGFVAHKGIGIEFLDYIAPPGGRPFPENSKPNDLWHWHTSVSVKNLEDIYSKLKKTDTKIISKEIVYHSKNTLKGTKSLLVRDPDGHAILLNESKN